MKNLLIRWCIKSFVSAVLCFIVMVFCFGSVQARDIVEITREAGYQVDSFYRPKASIVVDAQTGKILWQDQVDQKRPIASMSKIMTVYVALEKLKEKGMDLNTVLEVQQKYVTISQNYNLSNNRMKLGASYTIGEMLDLILVPSSNAATLMLADAISDNDGAAFTQMMNQQAQKIGMKDTLFYNCTGVVNSELGDAMPSGGDPKGDNLSTARDMAILVYHLLKKYPEILEHSKEPTKIVKAGTSYEETFNSYLFSLPGKRYGYDGFDGLKTGSSSTAGFNYAGTAERNGTRLIELIMGVGDWEHQESEEERHKFGNALFDQAFKAYQYKKVLSKGEQEINGKKIEVAEDLYDLVPRDQPIQFVLNDGHVYVAQDSAEYVQSSLKQPSVAYRKKRLGLLKRKPQKKASTNKLETSQRTRSLPYWLLLSITLFLVMIFLSIWLRFDVLKKQRHRFNQKIIILSSRFWLLCFFSALLIYLLFGW